MFFLFKTMLFGQCNSTSQAELAARQEVSKSNYAASIQILKKAIAQSVSCPDTTKSRLYILLSKSLMLSDQSNESYSALYKANTLAVQSENDEYLANVFVALAEYYRKTRKFEKADLYLKKTGKLIQKGKISDELQAQYYNRKAAIATELEFDIEKSIYYSKKCLAISKKIQNKSLEATSLNEIGFAYECQKPPDFERAILNYEKALEIRNVYGDEIYRINVLENIARVYTKNKQYEKAIIYTEQGYKLAKEKNLIYHLKNFIYMKYEYYLFLNKKDIALKTLQEYVDLNDIYIRGHWEKTIAEIESKFETKEKDKELELNRLKINNQELELNRTKQKFIYLVLIIAFVIILLVLIIRYSLHTKKANDQLKNLLAENRFLLGESNHRIKNNLQLITAIIYQDLEKQGVEMEESNWFEVVEKIESVSALHKQLYLNESKELINLGVYLQEIKSNFDSFFQNKSVSVDLEIDRVEISINKALHIGLLCTELFLNSLKHAFNEPDKKNTIKLILTNIMGKLELIYEDSGPGLHADDVELKLVHMLSKQLKFDYIIERQNTFYFKANFKQSI